MGGVDRLAGAGVSLPYPRSVHVAVAPSRRTAGAATTTDPDERRPPRRTGSGTSDGSWLADVAQAAGREAGDVPVEPLGDHLTLLADAAITGRRPHPSELDAVSLLGRRAAELGVSAGSAVQLYLCAARHPVGRAPDGDPLTGQRGRASRRGRGAARGRRCGRRSRRWLRRRPPARGDYTCPSAGSPIGWTGSRRSPASTRRTPRSDSRSTPRYSAQGCSAGPNSI